MGTNYYWRENVCPTCKHSTNETHIGKSSYGWQFSFQATYDCKSWADWRKIIYSGTGKIFDEYDEEKYPEEFESLVLSKQTPDNKNHASTYTEGNFIDPEGYSFSKGDFS